MKRVTGLGGVFFKCKDPKMMKEWYAKHLGIEAGEYGFNFLWRDGEKENVEGMTVWNPTSSTTKYFLPSEKDFMLNYRVENLDSLVQLLQEEGIEILGREEQYGKFAWIMDPEGNKIELWEPEEE